MEICRVGQGCHSPLNGAALWLLASPLSAPHALYSSACSGLPGWVSDAEESEHYKIWAAPGLSQHLL